METHRPTKGARGNRVTSPPERRKFGTASRQHQSTGTGLPDLTQRVAEVRLDRAKFDRSQLFNCKFLKACSCLSTSIQGMGRFNQTDPLPKFKSPPFQSSTAMGRVLGKAR